MLNLRDHEEDLPVEEAFHEPFQESDTETRGILEEYEIMMDHQSDSAEGGIILTETDTSTEPLEVIHLDAEEGTDYFEVIKDFDAGTAVVYSAIINRVDY